MKRKKNAANKLLAHDVDDLVEKHRKAQKVSVRSLLHV